MKLRKRWAALLATLAVAVAVVPPTPAAAAEIGPLQIMNYNSAKCIDIKDRSTANGATIHQWTCRREPHQLWWFTHQPAVNGIRHFDIRPQHMILSATPGCITNPNFVGLAGWHMKLHTCDPMMGFNTSQGFSLILGNEYESPLPTPGAQYRYRLINVHSQMCLEITGGSTSNGGTLQQNRCDGSAKQFWIITY